MTTTKTLTFHNDPELKDKLLARIGAHEESDAIAKGSYETWNGEVHRCAVGCSLRDLSDRDDVPSNWHAEMERVLGVPVWLAHLEDRVFESLPDDDVKEWPRQFSEAVPVGVSLDGLADRLAVRRLKEECLPLSGTWPESLRAEVVAAIELCIAALEGKGDGSAAAESAESAARSAAAWSAESAAAAARAAVWSAESAESAAAAARAAMWSAAAAARAAEWSAAARAAARAAESAAWKREADRIVEELRALA